MSSLDMDMTDAFVAAVKKIEHGFFVNDFEVTRQIRMQKIRERTKCGCETEESALRLRPKPVLAVARVNHELGGPLVVRTLPVIYYATHFASSFLPQYEIFELPLLNSDVLIEGVMGDFDLRFASVASIELVQPKFTYDEILSSDVHLWNLRQQICTRIPVSYKRDGHVLFSFFKTPEKIDVFERLSCYFKTSNRSLGTAPWDVHRDRLVHSALNQKMHTFELQVYSVPSR